jgi:ribonuclease D
MEAFYQGHTFLAHGTTTITANYTNMASKVEEHINKIELILEKEDSYKIVGLDVEYTYGPEQKAALIQLCMGTDCLLYQISSADQPCPKLADFLGRPDITFAGVDIGNDITRLGRCNLSVANFVDIQKRWKPADSTSNNKDSLADYAAAIIDSQYKSIMKKLTHEEHKLWKQVPLSMKHILYASIDAYATYEVYRRIVNFEKGQQKLAEFQDSGSKKKKKKKKTKSSMVQAVEAEEEDH